MKKKKLALFDMDGTLYDTKDVNFRSYKEALETVGIYSKIDYRYYCDFCNGNDYKIFLPILVPGITEEQLKLVHEEKIRRYPKNLQYARENKALFSLMETMKMDYVIALVTTASSQNTKDILFAFGREKCFDFLICKEDVENTKPNPEGFLIAMEKAGINEENTIIFEDSDTGIEAANQSGAAYVRVYGYN